MAGIVIFYLLMLFDFFCAIDIKLNYNKIFNQSWSIIKKCVNICDISNTGPTTITYYVLCYAHYKSK